MTGPDFQKAITTLQSTLDRTHPSKPWQVQQFYNDPARGFLPETIGLLCVITEHNEHGYGTTVSAAAVLEDAIAQASFVVMVMDEMIAQRVY